MQNPEHEGLVEKIFSEEIPVGPSGATFPGFHAQVFNFITPY